MIDLHMHTKYSDGTDTVIELLEKAEESGLEMISITDHDTCEAYMELETIEKDKYFSGSLIRGTELRAIYQGRTIEILGYGIDVDRIRNSKYIINQAGSERQKEYLEKMKKTGKEIGLVFDENIHIGDIHVFAAGTFGREIFSHEENKEIIEKYGLTGKDGKNDFYRKGQSNPESIFYIDETCEVPPPEIIINEIHKARRSCISCTSINVLFRK